MKYPVKNLEAPEINEENEESLDSNKSNVLSEIDCYRERIFRFDEN